VLLNPLPSLLLLLLLLLPFLPSWLLLLLPGVVAGCAVLQLLSQVSSAGHILLTPASAPT
jgi:hypothetical protein